MGRKIDQKRCYFCKKQIDISIDDHVLYDISTKSLRPVNRYFCPDCLPKYQDKKAQVRANNPHYELNVQEREGLDELWQYIDNHILKIPTNDKDRKGWFIDLTALRKGGLSHVTKSYSEAKGFPFSVILMAFKLAYDSIHYALRTKTFANETHKRKYIIAIVRGNLGLCYELWNRYQEMQLKAEAMISNSTKNNNFKDANYQEKKYRQCKTNNTSMDDLFDEEDW